MTFKSKWREIVFEADTKSGKLFDVLLLVVILLSMLVIMLESVPSISEKYGPLLRVIDWVFTILFTCEYLFRIYLTNKPLKYILSFYGIIDILSIIPTYMGLFVSGSHAFSVIRTIRLLRVFRILQMGQFVHQSRSLALAMRQSRPKIIVFMAAVFILTVILGTLIYIIEGPEHGFDSIPRSIYWAIVTLTTVGYGDLAPQTFGGQLLASIIMIIGYAIIAVPTGIVGVELAKSTGVSTKSCESCTKEGHDVDAKFCKFCGTIL